VADRDNVETEKESAAYDILLAMSTVDEYTELL
jgi:hypothetical protein